ncbi:MAG: Undecaprenyl-phosphate 4-deoxy-4-formamido-L-arabinose transferase [Elusimicrobia bacterium]|nr:Undecaprenyl-phosphate 4-deoxy-4-formamido-L-arabinose transferase [Elusimicrobiota bacterium]
MPLVPSCLTPLKKAVSILIPAYNEADAISTVINDLKEAFKNSDWTYEIIVVDDCSKDNTAQAAEKAGVKVISHPKNMGYGGALRTGIEHSSYDWVATIDADSSYPARELIKLLPHASTHDMVVGARQGKHYWGTVFKHPARLVFLALAQFVVGYRIPDVNSGLRMFRRQIVLEMLPRLCRGFSFSTTLTLSFLSSYRFVHFEPIEYLSRVGSSKVRYVRDTLRTLQLMLETIVYYNPLKAGVLLMLFPFFVGSVSLLLSLIESDLSWLFFSGVMYCFSLVFLGIGLILFLISHSPEKKISSR